MMCKRVVQHVSTGADKKVQVACTRLRSEGIHHATTVEAFICHCQWVALSRFREDHVTMFACNGFQASVILMFEQLTGG